LRRLAGARRAGEPDATGIDEELSSTIGWDGLGAVHSQVSLVLDIAGTYQCGAGEPPALRLWCGEPWRSLHAVDAEILAGGRLTVPLSVVKESSERILMLESVEVAIDPASWSRTLDAILWRAAVLLPRVLERIADDRATASPAMAVDMTPLLRQRRHAARAASSRSAMLARSAGRSAYYRIVDERWGIALQRADAGLPDTDGLRHADSCWIEADGQLADPMLVTTGGDTYLFAERFDHGLRGEIVAGRIAADGSVPNLRRVLARTHHLSYPQVFEDGGEIWMVPEMAEAGTVELLRADHFPDRWSTAATLLSGVRAYDATIHRGPDAYWMWAAVAAHGASRNAELWLYHAPSLAGPWTSHKHNPVVTDPRRARPAGSILEVDGRIYRFSQDGLRRYGHRMAISEVVELSADRYAEKLIRIIEPSWAKGLIATHTFSRSGSWQALDGLRRRPRCRV
jgi:hypothetical protein